MWTRLTESVNRCTGLAPCLSLNELSLAESPQGGSCAIITMMIVGLSCIFANRCEKDVYRVHREGQRETLTLVEQPRQNLGGSGQGWGRGKPVGLGGGA